MSITITHAAEDGTLVYGTSRGDGTNIILKAHGFRWFRTLGLWGLPNSRDRQPQRSTITLVAEALQHAGHEVRIAIDAAHRPVEVAEAARSQRAADRADALSTKATRKAVAAQKAWDAELNAAAAVPPGGEPIKIGHHSEKRHRKSIERAIAKLGQAVEAQGVADTAALRAQTAAESDARRYSPATVKNRIDRYQAAQRKDQRILDGSSRVVARTSAHTYRDESPPATGQYRQLVIDRMAQRADDITFWERIYAQQQTAGLANSYSRETITKGDVIQCGGGTWYEVARVNAKSVSVRPFAGAGYTLTIAYHGITGHRRSDNPSTPASDTPDGTGGTR